MTYLEEIHNHYTEKQLVILCTQLTFKGYPKHMSSCKEFWVLWFVKGAKNESFARRKLQFTVLFGGTYVL